MNSSPSIEVRDLTYTFPDRATGVTDVTLSLPARSRILLLGANGAGKTTLLRLLAGRRLAPAGAIRVAGADPFADGLAGVTYLGLEWGLNPTVRVDIGVDELLRSVGGDACPERRDELIAVLDVDTRWRLHAVSDGERRRVQLAMGLIRPWRVLLLDEITVDLDMLSRAEFLAWLRRETETRDCTIVYATHILDSLAGWATHLVHMHLGRVLEAGEADTLLHALDDQQEGTARGSSSGGGRGENTRLGELAMAWLREDLRERGPRNGSVTQRSEARTYRLGSEQAQH